MKTSSSDTGVHKNVNASNIWSEEVHVSNKCCFRCWSNGSNSEKCSLFLIIFLLFLIILMVFTFIFLTIEGKINFVNKQNEKEICLTSECVRVAANILERIDSSVDPCNDFYTYSCGNFIRNNPVPDDHYLKNLLQGIQDEIYFEMKNYLEVELNDNDGNAVKQIKLLYNSCVNESNSNNEKKAMEALLELLNETGGQWPLMDSNSKFSVDLEHRLSSLLLYQVQPFFQLYIEPIQSNKTQYAIHLLYGSTVLESTYLLNSGETLEFTDEINAYIDLQIEIAKIFSKFTTNQDLDINLEVLKNDIIDMVRLESDLSKISKESANESNNTIMNESLDDSVMNNDENYMHLNATNTSNMFLNITIEEMEDLYKSIKWKLLFDSILTESNADITQILINSREYLHNLNQIVHNYPPRVIDNYLCWTFIARYLPYLGPQFRRLFSEFRTKVPDMSVESGDPSGSSRIFLSRWKECVHVVSEGLDVPAIVLYLQHKQQTLDLMSDKIKDLIKQTKIAFNLIIDSQHWIPNQEIKDNFKSRINLIESKIGVPKVLTNQSEVDILYEELDIDPQDVLITNIFKMARHQVMLELKKLNRLVNPEEEWIIQPLIANAYYDPITNNIIMPPGILRYPLISFERPGYLDFATLGIVIGHEISHSMGTDSRKFMKYHNETNWWTNDINDIYKEKAKCFAQQYSQYLIESTDEYLNGNHTLEENICDFAGLQQSYTAYKLNRDNTFVELPGLTNYTSDQLFFIQYAQIWCEVVSDEGHRRSLLDDHSPGRYRANGVLVNTEQFSKAFNCPIDSPMNPRQKCGVWNSDYT